MKRFFNSSVRRFDLFLSLAMAVAGCGLLDPPGVSAAEVTVQNVRASQRAGTELVDIYYDLIGSNPVIITIRVSADGGQNWNVPAYAFTGAAGGGVAPGFDKHVVWNAGQDWDGQFSSRCRVRVVAMDRDPEFNLVPGGSFEMGSNANSDEQPIHTVFVSAFYMERTEVTMALWDSVRNWAEVRWYSIGPRGSGYNLDHPVHTVDWYDVIKWCNARSEMQGLTPVYYTDSSRTIVYRSGSVSPSVDWTANGYRLPTEAEWERAARGGLDEKRFPWGDTITHFQANYNSSSLYAYDTSPTRGYHPDYSVGDWAYTSPVASFQPNGYGLYDMSGNVWEWCWDRHGDSWYSQPGATQSDPRGPVNGSNRVLRGGSWSSSAGYARCATRSYSGSPSLGYYGIGFRCARAQ